MYLECMLSGCRKQANVRSLCGVLHVESSSVFFLIEIDGRNGATAEIVVAPEATCTAEPIVVQASAPGLKPVTISIPTSTDSDADGVSLQMR